MPIYSFVSSMRERRGSGELEASFIPHHTSRPSTHNEIQALIGKPLEKISPPSDGKSRVIVIDALDEIKKEWLPDALRLITDHLSKLPPWIRIIITSRDEAAIKKALLTTYKPTELKCDEKRNKQDVKAYLEHIVRENVAAEEVAPRDLEREVKREFG